MSRVVPIIDSDTGKLVDYKGAPRESGRYKKFVARMMSTGSHPVINYGAVGGDDLEISKNGGKGGKVSILADRVEIPGKLYVNGVEISDIGGDVRKSDIASLADGLALTGNEQLSDIVDTLKTLLERIAAFGGDSIDGT